MIVCERDFILWNDIIDSKARLWILLNGEMFNLTLVQLKWIQENSFFLFDFNDFSLIAHFHATSIESQRWPHSLVWFHTKTVTIFLTVKLIKTVREKTSLQMKPRFQIIDVIWNFQIGNLLFDCKKFFELITMMCGDVSHDA